MDEADDIPVYEAPTAEPIVSPDTMPRRGLEPSTGVRE